MRLREVAPRALLTLVALLSAAMLVAVMIARASGRASVPVLYRYAGVVENGRGAPAHYIARLDGFQFFFFDAASQGRRFERYRLCIGPPRQRAIRCWSRAAQYGIGKMRFSVTLPSSVPVGPLTARWLIAGRTVATWPFFHG